MAIKRITVDCVQIPAASEDPQENVANVLKLVDKARESNPDFVLLPELCTTPYWCLRPFEKKYFQWAETIPGPVVNQFSEKARQLKAHFILPIFEKGKVEGEYYNTAIVIGPEGNIIEGTLPDGTKVPYYRKNNPGDMSSGSTLNLEFHYFGRGWGYPVFETQEARIGILICKDRWFPEGWRVLALQGAEIIFVPVASWELLTESFVRTMRTWAQENQLFAAACNRAGYEGNDYFFGLSCIIGPRGEVLAQAPEGEGGIVISAEFDLSQIADVRVENKIFKNRRPELYGLISQLR